MALGPFLGELYGSGPEHPSDIEWVRWRAYYWRYHQAQPDWAMEWALRAWRELPAHEERPLPETGVYDWAVTKDRK